jgi:hypothetical protein
VRALFDTLLIKKDSPMMPKKSYRLAEYKITEDKDGLLWWETHFGFGALKYGKCFIKGDILFLEPGNVEEQGFLKLEFLGHLNRLPEWEKTVFYCYGYKIFKCSAFRKLALKKTDMVWKDGYVQSKTENQDEQASEIEEKDAVFRLGRYKIIEKPDGLIEWQLRDGRYNLNVGQCFIVENILFFSPGEKKISLVLKDAFIRKLIQLPYWGKTQYFCTRYALNNCTSRSQTILENRTEIKDGAAFKNALAYVNENGPLFRKGFMEALKEKAKDTSGRARIIWNKIIVTIKLFRKVDGI